MTRRLLFSCISVVLACGSDNSNGDGGSDATTSDTGPGSDAAMDVASGNDGSNGNDSSPGNDGGMGEDGSCVGSDAGCYACCAALDPAAAQKLFIAARACACNTPGDCNTMATCKSSLCGAGTTKPDKACVACVLDPDAGNCAENAVASCLDAGCGPVASCMEMCPP